ncbi:MAG: ParM/StbA family protein [Bacteroidales bacterium]|nr:ParM/StbA family protein [Bacteroidales bacterium]
MKRILGIDIGFGDVKVTEGTSDGAITKQYKFPSNIGITKVNEHVIDTKVYNYKGHNYYVGENAVHLPSENRIDITDYKNLEYYAPLFLYHVLQQIDSTPDIIVTGLSKAQINNSGHFQAVLKDFVVNETQFVFEDVYVLPQGAGSKITIDKYGSHFPKEQDEFLGKTTFVGCDIGFNTLDMFLVTDGKTSPNLFEGIEKEGIMKIATLVAKEVKEKHKRVIGLHEAKEVIDSGVYKLRGVSHPFKDFVDEIKKNYLKDLLQLIEAKYGKILDKCDFISISGGGSAIFKSTDDGFIRIPSSAHEYYNSIGFYLFGNAKS